MLGHAKIVLGRVQERLGADERMHCAQPAAAVLLMAATSTVAMRKPDKVAGPM